MGTKETFDDIYAGGQWGPGSGPGSQARSVVQYARFVQGVLERHAPAKVLDLGCGYFSSYCDINWPDYTGFDVATAPIEANRAYAGPRRRFEVRDWLEDELPGADLVLVKDVLQHWPHEMVVRGLRRLAAFPLVLVTNSVLLHPGAAPNSDIAIGGCRPLNLLLEPYRIPKPSEFCLYAAPDNAALDLKLMLLLRGEVLA